MPSAEMQEALRELEAERYRERIERQVLKDSDVDFGPVRPTDLKYNTRVHPPSEATKDSEAAILVQSDKIRKCIANYLSQSVETTILTVEQQLGKESITKRVMQGELLVTFTDKDGRAVLCHPSLYKKAAEVHTSKDDKVEWSQLKPTEVYMN